VNPDGAAALVPVWVASQQDGVSRITRLPEVPRGQAEEYYGLRYARWALEAKPDYQPAQELVLALAAERAVERSKFGNLAVAEPAVYKLLADAPSATLIELLNRGLAEKRTPLVLATVQALGDRADREAATPPAGPVKKPSLLVRALSYPDHAVQLAAATALLRGPVPVPPEAKAQVVDVLRRAVGTDPAKPAESKGTVLLVDPGKYRADANAALLRGFGYDVEVLAGGRDLQRRIARASDFDLIFIDHHAANPELRDLVAQVTSDPNAAGRPVYVIASPDKPKPPTFDQLMLRTAELIAATENDALTIPGPYTPDPLYTTEEQLTMRRDVQGKRDAAFRAAADARSARLLRLVDTLPIGLSADQRRLLELRVQLITFAVLGAEFPISPESAPGTAAELDRIRALVGRQPVTAPYGTGPASADLMKLIDRFELDVAKVKGAQEKYDSLRSRVDAVEIGLAVESFRDPIAEARLRKLLLNYPEVKVIPEPYTRLALEPEFKVLFADPMMVPREGAVKKADARAAAEFLRQMAVGDLPGYDVRPAEAELRAAVINTVDFDLASAAVDAVERLKSAEAQQSLLQLATRQVGETPVALRRKAADAAIRHVRANGKLATPTLVDAVSTGSTPEATPDAELRARLLTLKGMLAFNPGNFANELRGYNPPIIPAEPKKEPEKKEPEKKEPEKKDPPPT
jgi:CheY-like chemotaxis protein